MRFYSRFINIIRKLVKFRFVSLLCTTYKTDHSAVTTTRERDGRGSRGRVSLCRGRQSRKGKEAKDTTFQRLPRAVSFHPFLSAQERMPPEGMHYHKQQYCILFAALLHCVGRNFLAPARKSPKNRQGEALRLRLSQVPISQNCLSRRKAALSLTSPGTLRVVETCAFRAA